MKTPRHLDNLVPIGWEEHQAIQVTMGLQEGMEEMDRMAKREIKASKVTQFFGNLFKPINTTDFV